MTDPAHPPKVAVKPAHLRLHGRPKAKEPLHLHKRARYSLGSDPAPAPAVEKVAEKE